MFYARELNKRRQVLESALALLEEQEKQYVFPDGTLEIAKNGQRYKWFKVHVKDGRKIRQYIPVKDEAIARDLALKKYYKRKKSAIINELKATKCYLRYCPKELPDNLFYESPEYKRLLKGQVSSLPEDYNEWAYEDFDKNTQYAENLKVKTLRGDNVRSKSEAMIADALFRAGIPYRYECRLLLGGSMIYPDFTIKDPYTGEVIIWEHFGLMDSMEYIQSFSWKMKTYAEHGYIPNRNLIMTFEDGEHPLGTAEVYEIIDRCFGKKLLF